MLTVVFSEMESSALASRDLDIGLSSPEQIATRGRRALGLGAKETLLSAARACGGLNGLGQKELELNVRVIDDDVARCKGDDLAVGILALANCNLASYAFQRYLINNENVRPFQTGT